MKKTDLSDSDLCIAVLEMMQGLIDANLGGCIFKKRVATPGRGKSSGTRMLVATKKSDKWIYMFGFEKNERSNISDSELEALQDLAAELLSLSNSQLDDAVIDGSLKEICNAQKN